MRREGKEIVWAKYQKEIPEDKFYYVRSCIRQSFWPGSEWVYLEIMRNLLGKDVMETPEHTTCTGIGYHTDITTLEGTMTVAARNLTLAAKYGYRNFNPSCITSFGLYIEILDTWHHFPELKGKIARYLKEATGMELEIPEYISHPCDVLYKFRDELAAKAKYNLKGLRGVEHIGCHYAKMFPEVGMGGAEYCHVLVGMIEAFGGEVIDYPERRHCCGFGFRQFFVKANRGYTIACSKKKFDSMEPYKPDFILTNCPGCTVFLDRVQYAIRELEGKTYCGGIPVFTYEELIGLMLGYDPWDLGLQLHQVPVEPFLDKVGIKYDPDKKYEGVGGKKLPLPKNPLRWEV